MGAEEEEEEEVVEYRYLRWRRVEAMKVSEAKYTCALLKKSILRSETKASTEGALETVLELEPEELTSGPWSVVWFEASSTPSPAAE